MPGQHRDDDVIIQTDTNNAHGNSSHASHINMTLHGLQLTFSFSSNSKLVCPSQFSTLILFPPKNRPFMACDVDQTRWHSCSHIPRCMPRLTLGRGIEPRSLRPCAAGLIAHQPFKKSEILVAAQTSKISTFLTTPNFPHSTSMSLQLCVSMGVSVYGLCKSIQ